MPWFPWPESFKKRACRYLLQHYLGQFFQHKISVEQLSVDIFKGRGTISDVQLDVEAVNEFLENLHAPVEVKQGVVRSVAVVVPWSSLFKDNCQLEIDGLELTLALKSEGEAGVGLAGMASSMSAGDPMAASMKIAEDCMREDEEGDAGQYEGVEVLARMIDSVLSRVKVKLVNTLIRIEQSRKEDKAIALELHVDSLDYSDAAEEESDCGSSVDPPDGLPTTRRQTSTSVKNLTLFGVSFSLLEFVDLEPCHPGTDEEGASVSANVFRSRRFSSDVSYGGESLPDDCDGCGRPVRVAQFVGEMKVKVRLKQVESLPGPKVDVLCSLGSLHFFLTPYQLHLLLQLVELLMQDGSSDQTNKRFSHHMNERPMQRTDYELVEQQLHARNQTRQQEAQKEKERQNHQKADPWMLPTHSSTVGMEESGDLDSMTAADDEEADQFYSLKSDTLGLPPLGEPPLLTDSEHFESIRLEERVRAGSGLSTDRLMAGMKSFTSLASVTSRGSRSASSYGTPGGSYGSSLNQRIMTSRDNVVEDVAQFSIELGSLTVALLESDIQTSAVGENIYPVIEAAESFFQKLTDLLAQCGNNVGTVSKEKLASACSADHLRLSFNPFKMNVAVQMLSYCHRTQMELSVGSGEVLECLYGTNRLLPGVHKEELSPASIATLVRLSTPEIQQHSGSERQSASLKACVTMTDMITGQFYNSRRQTHHKSSANTDIVVNLGKLSCELNVTLVDRLSDILKHKTKSDDHNSRLLHAAAKYSLYSSMEATSSVRYQTAYHKAIDEGPATNARDYAVSVNCSVLRLTVRFPVADLRQPSEKGPWHRQPVRSQRLILECSEMKMKTAGCSRDDKTNLDIRFMEMQGHFCMAGEEKPVHFLTVAHTQQEAQRTSELPKVLVTIQPNVATQSELDFGRTPEQSVQASHWDAFSDLLGKPQSSPFSSTNVVYQDEQLVMPGNSSEMKEFEDCAVASSRYVVSILLPTVNIHMPSKQFYEDLYNRFCCDLLLWEPQSPQSQEVNHDKYRMEDSSHGHLYMCQSAIRPESDEDSLDSSDFKSAYQCLSDNGGVDRMAGRSSRSKQSLLSLTVNIRQGTATIITSAESGNNKPPSPEKLVHFSPESSSSHPTEQGEILVNIRDAHVFTVTSFQGNSQLQYVCLESDQFALSHVGLVDFDATVPLVAVGMSPSAATSCLKPTMYSSDAGVPGRAGNVPMLRIAMKIAADDAQSVKDVQLAVSVDGATLRHRMMPAEQTWFTQLSNFFNVVEDDVPGYKPMDVVTSLHTHLCHCTVDYRPLYLPWRVALTLGSLSVSSNIVYTSPQSVLRLILSQVELYLSDKTSDTIDLQDYVCVGDLGSFDLLLKTSSDPNYPSVVLEASNRQVNIWTCADTCVALRDLLNYFSSDGDLPQPSLPVLDISEAFKQSQQVLTQSNVEHLLDTPVQECNEPQALIRCLMEASVEDSHEPDESAHLADIDDMFSRQLDLSDSDEDAFVQSELSSAVSDWSAAGQSLDPQQDSTLSSYCILDMPGGKTTASHGSDPVVKCLLEVGDEIVIYENHMSVPTSKIDMLHPPPHYPTPVSTYILKELSITWHLFGGRDFAIKPEEKRSTCPSFATVSSNSPQITRKRNQDSELRKDQRKQRGGPLRNQDILMEIELSKIKVRFDTYAETSDKSSRLAALIGDVEIRDRLALSQLNKFLYCYSSQTMPRRSHASMVTVKLLCLRSDPESANTECCLHLGLLPIKLNVDQDALLFLKDFFEYIMSTPPAITTPLFDAATSREVPATTPISRMQSSTTTSTLSQSGESGEIIFRSFTFYPDLPLRVDYHGKRISTEQGFVAGLVLGLVQLSNSELTLKQLSSKKRLKGFGELSQFILNEWSEDIQGTMTGLLGGVGPVHALKRLGQGIVDLVWMPIQQYRKDGRVVRGLQKGSTSFGTSTAMATVELTNRAVQTIQAGAEIFFDFLSPAVQAEKRQRRAERKRRYGRQPVDMREGVTRAYDIVAQGLSDTATTISEVAQHEHEQGGITGAVTGILKVTPGVAVQPLIVASEAMSNVLDGVRNQFVPDARREQQDKYRAEQN